MAFLPSSQRPSPRDPSRLEGGGPGGADGLDGAGKEGVDPFLNSNSAHADAGARKKGSTVVECECSL